MQKQTPSPLQAAFWLTREERKYLLVFLSLLFLGLLSRYFYLKHHPVQKIEKTEWAQVEQNDE
jgi:hypothetical protein